MLDPAPLTKPRAYPYRPRLKPNLLATLMFAGVTAFFAHEASTNDRGLIINGIITLSTGQATVFHWCLFALGAAMTVAGVWNLYRRATSQQQLVLGPGFVSVPSSSRWGSGERRVSFGEIVSVQCSEVQRQRFARLTLRDGEKLTIAAGMLPGNAEYDEIVAALSRQRGGEA